VELGEAEVPQEAVGSGGAGPLAGSGRGGTKGPAWTARWSGCSLSDGAIVDLAREAPGGSS
jgi:hypothetical protein